MKSRIAACVAACVMAFPAAAAAATPSAPALGGPGVKTLQRTPAEILYSGDGSAFLAGTGGSIRHLARIHWSVWNASGARADGVNWLNGCVPNCAAGKFTAYPVSVHLYRPETVHGHVVFTRLNFVYTNPDLIPKTAAYSTDKDGIWQADLVLKYGSGDYFWN